MSLALILIRENPESMGLKPLGWDKQASSPASALKDTSSEPGIMFKESLKTPTFYFTIAGLILMMIIPQAINPNLSPLLQSAGYSAMAAANVLSFSNMLQIPAKILLGVMFDKMKAYEVAISEGVIMVLAPLCCIACMAGSGSWILIPLVIAYAFNYSLINMALPATASSVFGRKDFTMFVSLGIFSMLFANTFAGSIVAGSYDRTGSYMQGVWAIIIIGVASTLLLLLATKLSRKWMVPKSSMADKADK
jgi:cyanate permease